MRAGSWLGLVALAVLSLPPGPAAAQESFVLDLVDRGKALPDVPVTVRDVADLAGAGKPVGTTGSDGTLAIETDGLEIADGSSVEVWVVDCVDGEVEVVLVEEGTGDPCAGEAQEAGERCGCRRIGAFVWGADHVIVDVGAGTVTSRPPSGAGEEHAGGGRAHIFGLGAGFSYLPNLDDAVRDQSGLIDADVSSTGFTVPFIYELVPSSSLPFALGVGGSYTDLSEISQSFDPASGASLSTIDFSRWTVEGHLAWYQPVVRSKEYNPLMVRAAAVALWMFNDITARTTLSATGVQAVEDRSESGFRAGVLGGLDWFFTPRFGLRFEAGILFGKGNDADTSVEGRVFPVLIRVPF